MLFDVVVVVLLRSEEEDDENARFTIAAANSVQFTMELGGTINGTYVDIEPCSGNPAGDGYVLASCETIQYY